MNPGAIAHRNDGKFAAPMKAKEGIYVIAANNTIESICSDPSLHWQKLWLYPYKSVSGGVLTVNGATVSLGKGGTDAAQTLTDLRGAGTLATATLAGHNFEEGMTVTIASAGEAGYNGDFRIKNVTRDTFDYVVATAITDSNPSGTITAQRTRYLPDALLVTDTLGMIYQLPDGMKMRLSDVIIYGTAGDGVFYSFH
jgi:hypothetical protein